MILVGAMAAAQTAQLKFSREFNAKCPGFESDIHGLVEEPAGADGRSKWFVDCVRKA